MRFLPLIAGNVEPGFGTLLILILLTLIVMALYAALFLRAVIRTTRRANRREPPMPFDIVVFLVGLAYFVWSWTGQFR